MNRFTITLIVAFLSPLYFASCAEEGKSSVDSNQARESEQMLAEADRQVGMPNVTNFTERKLMKQILELRDQEGLRTWTYIVDMHGKLHFLTESIGYGIPYSTQFTNPERVDKRYMGAHYGHSVNVLPQADPNGLFMPTGLSATWIIASTDDGPKPMYVEPEILVSPFKMEAQ